MIWTVAIRFPVRARVFSLLHINQIRLWDIPSLLSNGYCGSFPGDKTDNSPPSSAEAKKVELYLHSFIRFPGVVFN
jgi:hypothetical protein